MEVSQVVASVRTSSLAELWWLDPHGSLTVRGVVALARGDIPVVAFTYADEEVARQVAASPLVCLTLTETRSTGPAFRPLLVRGRPRLTEDPDGEVFTAELLDEELRRFPPSRVYADSPLLRRENWWYLPRLIVELSSYDGQPTAPRETAHDHLLGVSSGETIDVHVTGIDDAASTRTRLVLRTQAPPTTGQAVLFGQDASMPDLEQWSQWTFRGSWDGSGFAVHEAPASVGLRRVPTVMQRWRRHRELERRCRRAFTRR